MRRGEGLPEPGGSNIGETVYSSGAYLKWRYNANADVRYLSIRGDFDQGIHLIQPTNIFLPG